MPLFLHLQDQQQSALHKFIIKKFLNGYGTCDRIFMVFIKTLIKVEFFMTIEE